MKIRDKIIIAVLLAFILFYCCEDFYTLPNRPTVETRNNIYVVPWPWELQWDGTGFLMRLDVK